MKHHDVEFINRWSSSLRNFRWKKSNQLANFSCPICGDSQVDSRKARGYLFWKKDVCKFKCFNCQKSMTFGKLLKQQNPELFKAYCFSVFAKDEKKKDPISSAPMVGISTPTLKKKLDGCICINRLNKDHPCRTYVESRKIPLQHHKRLFFTEDFRSFVNLYDKDAAKNLPSREPRLIIPFYDKTGEAIIAFQGRSLDPNASIRYITIKVEKDAPKIFGLERVDWKKPLVVVEGPIDSLFLNHAIAMAGAEISEIPLENDLAFMLDSQPRNREIVAAIERLIDDGKKVVLLPSHFTERGKDVNEMILNGIDRDELNVAISTNTFQGLEAKIRLMDWKKI